MSVIITALDFDDPATALALVEQLDPALTRLKIGKELFTRAGPDLVDQVQSAGFEVFLDLKFHDIPSTVAGALRAAQAMGVWMVNVHASGGPRMLESARAAIDKVARGGSTRLIAVTVLTSFDAAELAATGIPDSPAAQVARLVDLTRAAGLDGVVCSPREVAMIRAATGADFLTITPGIRPSPTRAAGASGTSTTGFAAQLARDHQDDQRRTLTPCEAISAGSDYLVIGRPITRADDPLAALEAIVADLPTCPATLTCPEQTLHE